MTEAKNKPTTDSGLGARLEVLEEQVATLEKQQNNHARWRRGASENWKNYCETHVGNQAEDGKMIGNVRIGLVMIIAFFGLIGMALAESISVPIFEATTYGEAKFDGDSVTLTTTLTVDNLTATGTVTSGALTISGNVDANSFTVDAGAGLDNQAAGSLEIGASVATSVNIADAGVTTDIQGPLTILGTTGVGLDTAGSTALFIAQATATSLSLGASDIDTISLGRILVLGSTGEGIDANGATALFIGQANATTVSIGASDADTIILGGMTVLGGAGNGLDATAGVDLPIGEATATSVSIADAGVTTDIQGPLTILGTTGAGLDTAGATALFIAEATATSLSLGASDIDTTILGPLNVLEATGKGIDTTGAGLLFIGEAVATGVTLGAADADVIVAGDLDVVSRLSMGHLVFTTSGPTDNLDVSGINFLICDGTSATVVIGGFVGGVVGQILFVTSIETANGFTLENAEGGGSQDIFLSAEADTTVATKGGGVVLGFNGTAWYECAK